MNTGKLLRKGLLDYGILEIIGNLGLNSGENGKSKDRRESLNK